MKADFEQSSDQGTAPAPGELERSAACCRAVAGQIRDSLVPELTAEALSLGAAGPGDVADAEREARRLLDHLDLAWDPACLRFYETARAVRTASVAQVRKPIYASSVARWKHFEENLGVLLELVGPTAASPASIRTSVS